MVSKEVNKYAICKLVYKIEKNHRVDEDGNVYNVNKHLNFYDAELALFLGSLGEEDLKTYFKYLPKEIFDKLYKRVEKYIATNYALDKNISIIKSYHSHVEIPGKKDKKDKKNKKVKE